MHVHTVPATSRLEKHASLLYQPISLPSLSTLSRLVYPPDLIQLVGTREKRVEAGDLEEHTAGTPLVHLGTVVTVGEKALRGPVPSRRDVLRIWLQQS